MQQGIIMPYAYAKALDAWRNTDEYREASNPRTLRDDGVKYLMNRLEGSFAAGWRAALGSQSRGKAE